MRKGAFFPNEFKTKPRSISTTLMKYGTYNTNNLVQFSWKGVMSFNTVFTQF